jgi:hypothetical protein
VSLATAWGTTPAERALPYPCDGFVARIDAACWRGVSVRAGPATIFRWLCQLKLAPYSYDWIDNLGRRSPRRLVPGAEQLALGQRVMTIFELVAFEPGVAFSVETPAGSSGARLFGQVNVTYWARSLDADRTRLLAKLRVAPGRGVFAALMRASLPWGDLVMMRRQLLNLKRLAERDAQNTAPRAPSASGSERSSA